MILAEREMRPWVVLVGGFLGSGKTSLILAAAQLLDQRGLRCAVILNDQGDELVDERHTEARGMLSRAVTGGCFCCKFSGLMTLMEELRTSSPDVIFAEPVGSCTDISATVVGPLREQFDRYRVAPLTVLVDPARAATLLSDGADSDLAFLFQKQLQEADLVCMSKADHYPDLGELSFPDAFSHGLQTRRLSSSTGEGVQEWLDEILFGSLEAGMTTLDIDYARYAQAEAALAWLNASLVLELASPLSPALVVGPLLDRLDEALTQAGISIVHLKLFDNSPAGWLKAALCVNGEEPRVEGNLDASPTNRHELLVNLRAKGGADEVRKIVEAQLCRQDWTAVELRLDAFSPAAPKPERRVPRIRR
jgi:hypothetical protein